MGLGDLGELGDIGMIVGSVVGIGISAIVLLTFAPGIVGDIDGFSLAGTDRCELIGERFRWILPAQSGLAANATGEDHWAAARSGGATPTMINTNDLCARATPATKANSADEDPTYATFYTPKGTKVQYAATAPTKSGYEDGTKGFQVAPTWKNANASLTALSGGTIVLLLFSASAILVPAGAIGFLGYFGARFIASNIGGGVLSIAIGATVIVVLAGAILPEVFEPLDRLYLALDGTRFWVYSVGIGKLGPIIGNFLGIALLGGIVTLGMLLWKGHSGSGRMANAM